MKKIFFILIFTFLLINQSYAKDSKVFVSDLTIKELSENIEKLKVEKIEFQEKNKELSKEYWELISFIRTDLNDEEIVEIKQKVEVFMNERNWLQKTLKEKIDALEDSSKEKKDIIIHRANFYKYIAKYVQKEKREDFIAHIKFQVQSEKESKDLIEEILTNQNILDQKVIYIKEKIEIHKEDLQAKIEVKIISKIKQRIDEIDNNEKYEKIDQKIKNQIYSDFIHQIKKKLKEIETANLSENYREMRKNLLSKMIDEITLKIKDPK